MLDFDLFGDPDDRKELLSDLLLRFLELSRLSVLSDCLAASGDNMLGGCGSHFLSNFIVSTQSCVKGRSLIIECTGCLISPGSGHFYIGVETIRRTTALIKISEYEHSSKYCNRTSTAALLMKNMITIVCRNWVDAIFIPFGAEMWPSRSMSARFSSIRFWTLPRVRSA